MASNDQERPTGLKGTKGIELLTWGTPNGQKISVFLEELKAAYGIEYTWQGINIGQNIQKEPWFTKLGPNGRIPVIVDHDNNDFPVMEGAAILAYLARKYDTKHLFSFEYGSNDFSLAEQWISWQHGGLGPMQGQANHFFRAAKERIPYATQRYVGETERLYGVLDKQLEGREYIVGPGKGKFSIADMANFGWVNSANFGGLDVKKFKNIDAWLQRINERKAVQAGLNIPGPPRAANAVFQKRLTEDEEFAKQNTELSRHLKEAQDKYEYKFQTP